MTKHRHMQCWAGPEQQTGTAALTWLTAFTHFSAMQITCTDSAGGRHRQLVKSGNDDLRQDAVMQQFFELVNNVLHTSEAARKRQLHIRTYKARHT